MSSLLCIFCRILLFNGTMNPSVYDKSLSRVRSVQVDGVVNQCNNMQHVPCVFLEHKVLGARTLLGAPGIATRSKKLLVARCLTSSSKKLLGAKGISTRSPPGLSTRSKKLVGAKGVATRSKDAGGSWHCY